MEGFLMPKHSIFCYTKFMPNDDLGQFPMPPQNSTNPPVTPDAPPPAPAFEPTPDELPSQSTPAQGFETTEPEPPEVPAPAQNQETAFAPSNSLLEEQDKLIEANENIIENQAATTTPSAPVNVFSQSPTPPAPLPTPSLPEEMPATVIPKSSSPLGPIIFILLIIIAGVGLAAAAFMYQRSASLTQQLQDITQTLQSQKTTITPTPTGDIFEIPTPTITPSIPSTISATPTASPTAEITPSISINNYDGQKPLSLASQILRIAINHQPNAQFILLKTDNAQDPQKSVTKYFFRQDLTVKKYFYVSTSGTNEPEVVDKQIYVQPDNNIPSLNDTVLQGKLGIDLNEAITLTINQCTNKATCQNATMKAQYIYSGNSPIWQLTLTVSGKTQSLIIQINAQTKEIIYKSPEFATI